MSYIDYNDKFILQSKVFKNFKKYFGNVFRYEMESKEIEVKDGPAVEISFDLKSLTPTQEVEKNEQTKSEPEEPDTLEVLVQHINKLRDAAHREKQTFIEPKEFKHHHYDDLEKFMRNISQRFPDITRLYSVGKSVQGRELWTIEITDNPGIHEPGEYLPTQVAPICVCSLFIGVPCIVFF
jgi:hypothetical protein